MKTDVRYMRVPRVLWRIADVQVLTRRVPPGAEGYDAQLGGPAAVVWLALDRPRSWRELVGDLERAGSDDPTADLDTSIDLLTSHGLVQELAP